MGAPSSFLKSLSLRRIRPRAPAAVVPSPVTTQFDRELTAELDTLKPPPLGTSVEQILLVQFLDAAITTQKIALDSLANISYKDDVDREAVEEYLENNINILDACNFFMERIDNMKKKYVYSLRVIARLINANATTRALDQLDSCHEIEKQCKGMRKSLRRMLMRQKLCHESELSEIMCGSKVMALMGCKLLELGLSFDSNNVIGLMAFMKQSQPMSCSWLRLLHELAKQAEGSAYEKKKKKKLNKVRSGCLMMIELQKTVNAAQELKEQIKGRREKEVIKSTFERLKKSSKELEEGLEVLEGRVKDLYKSLIDVRMVLLGILSQA
ncbi:hypothetical protein RIF29_13465 [Crotalaria pallida]|uniref:Uncharacterized protein n=1 Tax=Crotalaria pallida TaxID=3830 RepID=A0AAN9IP80_CROPI